MRQAVIQSANYKWWAFGTIAIGTFLSVIDHGSVLVALPSIESHFHADLPTVQWVVLGYTLTISVLLLPMGRLGDIIGRKQVYIAGFSVFALGAALAGAAINLPMLITAKVLQGAGSAMIQGNAMAMIVSVFPARERGKALGSNLSVVGTGAIVGPALGGLLVDTFGWRSVFLASFLVGIIPIAAAMIILDQRRFFQETQPGQQPGPSASLRPALERREGTRFDWMGAALSGGALLCFLLVMGNGHRVGWASAPIVVGLLAFMGLLATFIWWELRTPSPMLELRLFQRRLVAFGVAAGWVAFLGGSSVYFMMPFYLQRVLGYSPRESGLMVIPGALCLIIMGFFSGRLSDRFGWRKFNLGGLALSAAALFTLANMLAVDSSLALIIPLLMLQSCGTGLFNTPNNSSILSAVERYRYGVVSSLTQLMRNTANVTSVSLATTIVVITMASQGFEPSLGAVSTEEGTAVAQAFVSGLRRAFMILGSLLVLGIVLSYFKGERAKESVQPSAISSQRPATRPRAES